MMGFRITMVTTSGRSMREFYMRLIKVGRPTLNVGGTVSWVGTQTEYKREEQERAEQQHDPSAS